MNAPSAIARIVTAPRMKGTLLKASTLPLYAGAAGAAGVVCALAR